MHNFPRQASKRHAEPLEAVLTERDGRDTPRDDDGSAGATRRDTRAALFIERSPNLVFGIGRFDLQCCGEGNAARPVHRAERSTSVNPVGDSSA